MTTYRDIHPVIVICCDEDGDISFEHVPKNVFLDRLKEQYYGEKPTFANPGSNPDLSKFVGLIVIQGDVCVPRAVKVSTEYRLPSP